VGRLEFKCDGTRWHREGKWRGNWRMQWVASNLHTTSEHGVSSITTADARTSAASSRLNWRPRRFKWTRPFRRKTKSGFCACAITFQLACTTFPANGQRETATLGQEISAMWGTEPTTTLQKRLLDCWWDRNRTGGLKPCKLRDYGDDELALYILINWKSILNQSFPFKKNTKIQLFVWI